MNTTNLYNYLKDFMKTNNWYSNNTQYQARCIFTTICIIKDIKADNYITEDMLLELFVTSALEDLMDYEDFEEFMCEYLESI
ncbi:MAG: hypothetical protein UIM53_06005 [Acutalibacteraceae bacterium]|nr:hypothetical protein [Acutalibacteraceae bacterium]